MKTVMIWTGTPHILPIASTDIYIKYQRAIRPKSIAKKYCNGPLTSNDPIRHMMRRALGRGVGLMVVVVWWCELLLFCTNGRKAIRHARGCPTITCRLHSCCLFVLLSFRFATNPSSLSCPQFCPSEHPSGAPPPDGLRCVTDQHDYNLRLPHPIPPIVPAAMAFHDRVHHLGSYRPGT
jgi:hypothetical protein